MTEVAPGVHIKPYVLFRYDETGLDGEMDSMVDSLVVVRSDHKIEEDSDEGQKIRDIVYPIKWDTKPGTVVPIRDGDDLICRLKKAGYDAFYMGYDLVELCEGESSEEPGEEVGEIF